MSKKNELAALEKIENEYGKGTILKMDDEFVADIEAIPTGIPEVDDIMGIGGYPIGRIVDLFGAEGSGKCLTKDTLIHTPKGLLTIEEIFQGNGIKLTVDSDTTEVTYPLLNQNGTKEFTTKFTKNGRRKVYKVTTESGFEFTATSNNPIKIMDKSGFLVWECLKSLKEGQYIATHRKAKHRDRHHQNSNYAYLLGILIADGYLGEEQRITITNDDSSIINFLKKYGAKYITNNIREYKEGNSTVLHFNDKDQVIKYHEDNDIDYTIAKGKEVPPSIRKHISRWKSFLQGYFDCESSISDRNIEVTSASHKLLYQIKLMLQQFGIVASLKKRRIKDYPNNNYWRLYISGHDVDLYLKLIGFKSSKKQSKAKSLSKNINISNIQNTNNNVIPHQRKLLKALYKNMETTRKEAKIFHLKESRLTYRKLKHILNYYKSTPLFQHFQDIYNQNYFYDRITDIEYIGEKPTFDFEMKNTHSFIANGIIAHNTTLALHGLQQALKQDKICVFVDAEHSLNTEYAKSMGIDLSDVYIYQPTTAEEAFDIINLLVEDADYIIVDSMPALVPKKELEGKAEDQNVGLQARIFSKELRKLQGKVRKADTSIVCINQMRDKIDGSGWGKSWKTTGGRALKFYSSIRLEVKAIGRISDKSNNQVGHKVKIQARKNKLAAPFKEAVVSLIYGRGIDTSRSWLSKAIATEVITRNGSWYYYGEKKLGQGESAALKFVRENKQKIKEDVNEVTKQKDN